MVRLFDSSFELPPTLQVERSCGAFWWRTTEKPPGRRSYAVCIHHSHNAVSVSVLRIVGFLNGRPSGREGRLRTMHLLVRDPDDRRVFKTVFDYVSDLRRGSVPHLFVVRADSEAAAKQHPSVRFVLSTIKHYRMERAFYGIYFISNGHGAIKIGQTGVSLSNRLNSCQVGSPHRLYVVAVVDVGELAKTEKMIHRKYRHLHIRGEWFAMHDDEAVAAAEELGGRRWDRDTLPEDEHDT